MQTDDIARVETCNWSNCFQCWTSFFSVKNISNIIYVEAIINKKFLFAFFVEHKLNSNNIFRMLIRTYIEVPKKKGIHTYVWEAAFGKLSPSEVLVHADDLPIARRYVCSSLVKAAGTPNSHRKASRASRSCSSRYELF